MGDPSQYRPYYRQKTSTSMDDPSSYHSSSRQNPNPRMADRSSSRASSIETFHRTGDPSSSLPSTRPHLSRIGELCSSRSSPMRDIARMGEASTSQSKIRVSYSGFAKGDLLMSNSSSWQRNPNLRTTGDPSSSRLSTRSVSSRSVARMGEASSSRSSSMQDIARMGEASSSQSSSIANEVRVTECSSSIIKQCLSNETRSPFSGFTEGDWLTSSGCGGKPIRVKATILQGVSLRRARTLINYGGCGSTPHIYHYDQDSQKLVVQRLSGSLKVFNGRRHMSLLSENVIEEERSYGVRTRCHTFSNWGKKFIRSLVKAYGNLGRTQFPAGCELDNIVYAYADKSTKNPMLINIEEDDTECEVKHDKLRKSKWHALHELLVTLIGDHQVPVSAEIQSFMEFLVRGGPKLNAWDVLTSPALWSFLAKVGFLENLIIEGNAGLYVKLDTHLAAIYCNGEEMWHEKIRRMGNHIMLTTLDFPGANYKWNSGKSLLDFARNLMKHFLQNGGGYIEHRNHPTVLIMEHFPYLYLELSEFAWSDPRLRRAFQELPGLDI